MKKIRSRSKWLLFMYCGIGMLLMAVAANIILNKVIQNQFSKKLQQLSPLVKIRFSSVKSNLLTSSLSLNDLKIDYIPDSNNLQHEHSLYFSAVEFHGINYIKFLFRQTLSINNLKLSNGDANLDQLLLNKKDTSQKNMFAQAPFRNISINHFESGTISIWMHADKGNELLLKANIGIDEISINDVKKALTANDFHFGAIKCSLSEVNYVIPEAYHVLKIKQITIDSKKRVLQVDSLKIIPQFSKSDFFKNAGNQPLRIESTIANITILKLDVWKLLAKKLSTEKIIFNDPDLNIYGKAIKSQKPLSRSFPFTYLKEIPLEIQIDTLSIHHSSVACEESAREVINSAAKENFLTFMPSKGMVINHLEITKANLSIDGDKINQLRLNGDIGIDRIKIDRTDSSFNNVSSHFTAFTCTLTDIHYAIPGAYHNMQMKKLIIDSKKEILQIVYLKIIPQYNKFEQGQKLGHQTDVIEASFSDIKIAKLNVLKLFQKKLLAEKIRVGECNIYVFRDRRLPRLLQYQPLPVAFLDSIPLYMRVDNFQVDHSAISYEEFPKEGLQTGILTIEKFQLSLSPLINHRGPSDPDHMDMKVAGAIMGSGAINASVYIPFDPKKDYYVNGMIENLELTSLNSSAENLGKFHIESGILNYLSFHFNLNDEKTTGKVVGEYHNLVVHKLKGNNKKIAGLKSYILQHVIIPKNKDKSLPVAKRTGKIDYEFDHTRFISFYLLKSLLSGIRSSFTFGFLLPK